MKRKKSTVSFSSDKNASREHVVIVGGGFAGLYAALSLGKSNMRVTLIDKRNFHLFQPLLYQVATGGLSPGDIASPLRAVLNRYDNITVLNEEVIDIDPVDKRVITHHRSLCYNAVVVAAGATHHHFGNSEFEAVAPPLKTIEHALDMRTRILRAFEQAERETDPIKRKALLTFVIVGGGPTGVELAGALTELAYNTLAKDFRNFDPMEADVVLLEGAERLLPSYPPVLSRRAAKQLWDIGATILTDTMLESIDGDRLRLKVGEMRQVVRAQTVLWAAGVKAAPLGELLCQRVGLQPDRLGRVLVMPDLSIRGYPDFFVLGDLANFSHQNGKPLPGIAPVAMQQGRYVAKLLINRQRGKTMPAFRYRDKGSLAVIGRNAAVADFGRLRLSGFPAWILWAVVHIRYLIEFDNKFIVLFQWAWNYFTRKRGARLITLAESRQMRKQQTKKEKSKRKVLNVSAFAGQ
ncbi:NAD(P)/FAD-dependent oxidoreductase [candidate division KSB1 bacterium]|nr:NAD(P)/FAD-dependent oxidoreductase [candidate division KSB1 bacterium]